jgi:hypothetical protein
VDHDQPTPSCIATGPLTGSPSAGFPRRSNLSPKPAAAWTAARSSRGGLSECVVTKRPWGNPATGCGTPTQPGPSDGWSDTRRVYRPGFLPPPSSLSPPSSLNLLRPRASRAVPTGSLSGRDRRTCEKTIPCSEILRRRAPHVGSARG